MTYTLKSPSGRGYAIAMGLDWDECVALPASQKAMKYLLKLRIYTRNGTWPHPTYNKERIERYPYERIHLWSYPIVFANTETDTVWIHDWYIIDKVLRDVIDKVLRDVIDKVLRDVIDKVLRDVIDKVLRDLIGREAYTPTEKEISQLYLMKQQTRIHCILMNELKYITEKASKEE